MKTLIASDIHGSTACIKKLLKRIEEEKVDRVVFLGDILYHGPKNALPDEYNTEEAAKLLNQKSELIIGVRGNCDSEVDETLLDFSIGSQSLILSDDGLNIFATHGHYYNIGHLPPIASFDVLLHGHTHVPAFEEIKDGKYYINPGSVSIPKENSDHSYIVYEKRKFTWKTLDGKVYREETL